jgi:hypothetical protein
MKKRKLKRRILKIEVYIIEIDVHEFFMEEITLNFLIKTNIHFIVLFTFTSSMAVFRLINIASRKYMILSDNIYLCKKTNGSTSYWSCRTSSCASRVTLYGDLIKNTHSQHESHESPISDIILLDMKKELEAMVLSDSTRPGKEIYDAAILKQVEQIQLRFGSDEHVGLLPSYESLEPFIYRTKKKNVPRNAESRENIVLSGLWTQTLGGNNFVLANDGAIDKIIIFGTKGFLGILCDCNRVYMDGTFYSSPQHFSQLYTLHGMFKFGNNERMFPLLYVLLPGKTRDIYLRMFSLIKVAADSHNMTFNPNHFHIDFEKSVINALNISFSNPEIHGCFFHYTQAIWRKVQDLKLVSDFKGVPQVRRTVRRVAALPFLPTDKIIQVFDLIKEQAPQDDSIKRFINYSRNTWVKEGSLFNKDIWNHHGNFSSRTTNHLEGWHNKLNKSFGRAKPTIFAFISVIKNLQKCYEVVVKQMQKGKKCVRQNNKYVKLNDSLKALTLEYFSGAIDELKFIDDAGYLLHLQSHKYSSEDIYDGETEIEDE